MPLKDKAFNSIEVNSQQCILAFYTYFYAVAKKVIDGGSRVQCNAVQEWKNGAIKSDTINQPVEHEWPIMATAPADLGAALQYERIQDGSEEAAEDPDGSKSETIDETFSLL
eukprot:gene15782-7081_t